MARGSDGATRAAGVGRGRCRVTRKARFPNYTSGNFEFIGATRAGVTRTVERGMRPSSRSWAWEVQSE